MEQSTQMYQNFLEEYGSDQAVQKYTSGTAGYGISYLLDNDYAELYLRVVDSYLRTSSARPLRVLEFGCGGGMNIIRLAAHLQKRGVPVECAYGTDFSVRLIQAAKEEANAFLPAKLAAKLNFHPARNERLLEDLSMACGKQTQDFVGFFDLIVGVNTFRYCHRLKKELDCTADIHRMLKPGGVCIIIDMNDRFPAFRSRLKGLDKDPVECYVPTLDEYASPFKTVGFEMLREGNFCWIPHSAGPALTLCCRILTPLLDLAARSRAMRSLVIARKPA
jgi:SAM-dependent methyltransferase